MDISKDTLYIEHADHPERRAFQTVMYDVLLALSEACHSNPTSYSR